MKRYFKLMIVFLVSAFLLGCHVRLNPVEPEDPGTEEPTNPGGDPGQPGWMSLPEFIPQAEVTLVKTGDDGGLGKTTVTQGSDISFGDVLATKKLNYIVMNSGNLDLFDVTFSADSLLVFPSTIGRIDLPEGGISSTPIVSFTMEHVLPAAGVGSLLPMNLGVLNDNVSLSYKYEIVPFEHSVLSDSLIVSLMDSTIATSDTTADTVWVAGDTLNVNSVDKDTLSNSLDYSVTGTRRGAVIEIYLSGQRLKDFNIDRNYNYHLNRSPWSNWSLVSFQDYFDSQDIDTSSVTNSGNAPLRIRVANWENSSTFIDTLLGPGETINTTGIFTGVKSDSRGGLMLFGNEYNQPYIYTFMDIIETDGWSGVFVSQN